MIKQPENKPFSSQQKPQNMSVAPTPVSLWKIEKILQIVTKTCSLAFKKIRENTNQWKTCTERKIQIKIEAGKNLPKYQNAHRIKGLFNYLGMKNMQIAKKKKKLKKWI